MDVTIYSLEPYMIRLAQRIEGVPIDLTGIMMDKLGASWTLHQASQWIELNGSRISGGTVGRVRLF